MTARYYIYDDPAIFRVHVYGSGVVMPANKLTILAPYLALVRLVGAVTVAVGLIRRRKA